jgi:hypothetical protein
MNPKTAFTIMPALKAANGFGPQQLGDRPQFVSSFGQRWEPPYSIDIGGCAAEQVRDPDAPRRT